VSPAPALVGGFVPPVYPFDKLAEFAELAARHDGGAVDLSVGTPCDPPPGAVLEALGHSGSERGYPTSVGSAELREAAAGWMERRLGVSVPPAQIAACIGSKELVAGVPHWLALRDPSRDTVLYPSLAYPTYEMGAVLAGCRPVPVPPAADGSLDLAAVSEEDAGRALCLWVNSPGNPSGQLDDLGPAASFGRRYGIPVFSDECYVEFTWDGRRHTILEHGLDGLVAVHSLSKRSNLAGLRAGFFAGDAELVTYLAAVRRHAGFMMPGPVQHASAVALADDEHVERQRSVYSERLEMFSGWLAEAGFPCPMPRGAFYLWVPVPEALSGSDGARRGGESPAFAFGRLLAERGGAIGSPGDAYGPAGEGHLRLALVQPLERLRLVAQRLGAASA
jgi:aspartate/methionine/tyrosine aminotransferase